MRLLLCLATKSRNKNLYCELKATRKTRGNLYKQKGRRFYAAAFDKSRISISLTFSLKFRK